MEELISLYNVLMMVVLKTLCSAYKGSEAGILTQLSISCLHKHMATGYLIKDTVYVVIHFK